MNQTSIVQLLVDPFYGIIMASLIRQRIVTNNECISGPNHKSLHYEFLEWRTEHCVMQAYRMHPCIVTMASVVVLVELSSGRERKSFVLLIFWGKGPFD